MTVTQTTWGADAALHLQSCSDQIMVSLAITLPPISLQLDSHYFARLLDSVVGQQISGRAAEAIRARVYALLGQPPTPPALVAAPDDALRACGLSQGKIRALRDLAERCLDGRLNLITLPHLSDAEVAEQLVAVRGIGPWTAHMFLMFGLGRPDILPVGDYGVRAAARRAYNLPDLPTPAQLLELAVPWRPYASAASFYLWSRLDAIPPSAR